MRPEGSSGLGRRNSLIISLPILVTGGSLGTLSMRQDAGIYEDNVRLTYHNLNSELLITYFRTREFNVFLSKALLMLGWV